MAGDKHEAWKPKGRLPVVGLVGGIGSGKSQVAAKFEQRGARVIAGDRLGHEALHQPDVRDRVVSRWGGGVLTESGEVDRRRLGSIVFADPGERHALEEIVFPVIRGRIREEIARAEADRNCRLVILDAAVLFEAGWNDVCDRVVYVDAPREVRLQRLLDQREWTAQEVEAREKAQLPLSEKARLAHDRLDNAGSVDQIENGVDELMRKWNL